MVRESVINRIIEEENGIILKINKEVKKGLKKRYREQMDTENR